MLSQKDLFKSAVLNAVNQFKIENKIDCPEIDEKLVRVENPPRPEMGDLGSPMFPFAKMFRMAPPAIAASVPSRLKNPRKTMCLLLLLVNLTLPVLM